MDKSKIYIVDMTTGKAIPWKDIDEISDTDFNFEVNSTDILLGEIIHGEELSFSIECPSTFDKFVDEIDVEQKPKSNPVYVPKHIARRKKW